MQNMGNLHAFIFVVLEITIRVGFLKIMLIIIMSLFNSCRPIACNFITGEEVTGDSSTSVFLRVVINVWGYLFYRTPAFSSFIFDLFWLQKQPFADVLQNSCSTISQYLQEKTYVRAPL